MPTSSNSRRGGSWLILFAVIAAAAGGAVRPDYNAARSFGFALQQDFAKRQSAAVIERVDEDALRRKVFAAYTDEVASSAGLAAAWKNVFYPGFLQRLKQLDEDSQMVLQRVLSLDGTRLLECELYARKGGSQLVYWELGEDADGKIHLTDQRLLGEELSYSRRLKHIFLVGGFSSMVLVGDEEMALERESDGSHERVREALEVMDKGALDEAFQRWSDLRNLKDTAIWRDVRLTMALRGGEKAMKSLQADIQAGDSAIEPVLRYNVAVSHQDYAMALRAMDELLKETHDAPGFQALKCDLLIKTHRAKEGLQLATGIYQLNPYSYAAYLQAAKAALSLDDFKTAQGVMRDWSQVCTPAIIDDILKTEPDLEPLRQTPAYQDWLKAPPPPKAP